MKRDLWKLVAVAVAVLLGGFLRMYRLDSVPPGLYVDESTDGNDALAAWRTGDYRIFYPENYGREGLLINLQAVALGLTGISRPWVLRLPGALLGTLTIFGMFLLARQLGLLRAAWLAAWIMATSFWHIDVSRMGTRVVAAPFFLIFSLWLWGLAAREVSDWRGWAALAGLCYGLGFYTYPAYRLTPLLVLIAVGRFPKKVNILAGAVALLTVLPLAIFAIGQPEVFFQRLHVLPGLATGHPLRDLLANTWKAAAMFNIAGDLNPRHNLPGRPMLFWPVGLLFLTGLVIAARRQRLLLWWLVIGLLPAILANEGMPHSWRGVLAAPAAFLLAGLGADWLLEQTERQTWRSLAPALAVILAVAIALDGYRSYFLVWARDARVAEWFDSSLLKIADQLQSVPQNLPKYVLLGPDVSSVRGLPIAAQTIMFLTDTATPDRQAARNIHYLRDDQTNEVPLGYVYVTFIESSPP